jgi:hypothetical protein
MNKNLEAEILEAIKQRMSDTFRITAKGNLNHLISSEGISEGLYIGKIDFEGKEFKIYMI